MDGLAELTAADITWKVAGQEYRLSPLTLADYGEIEKQILVIRPKPLAVVSQHLSGLPDELQKYLVALAYKDEARGPFVSRYEVQEWLTTMSGHIYRMYLMLRHNHPITTDQVAELLRKADDSIADEMDGMPSGNSSGRTPTNGVPANRSPLTGAASFAA